MQIKKLKSIILAGLSATVLSAPLATLAAQTPGIYIGGEWGAYSIHESNLKEHDNVLKAYVGGQFNSWFGLEGSWTDFNRLNNGNDRFEADGKGLSAVFSFPVGTASSVFVKAGEFWWNSDSSLGSSLNAKDGNDPFYGVGFKYGFNEHLALRVEGEHYDVANSKLRTLLAGLEFKF